jgi:hypothetical protein
MSSVSKTSQNGSTPITPGPLDIAIVGGRVREPSASAEFLRQAPIGMTFGLDITSGIGAIVTAVPRSTSPTA